MKQIIIKSCADCPHKGHKGAFLRVSFIPCCDKKGYDILGYTTAQKPDGSGSGAIAIYDGVIPEWCPLEDFK